MCAGYAGVLDDAVLDEIFADIFARQKIFLET